MCVATDCRALWWRTRSTRRAWPSRCSTRSWRSTRRRRGAFDAAAGIIVVLDKKVEVDKFFFCHFLLVGRSSWKTYTGTPQEFAPLSSAITEYQDPSKADKISAIQKELDETTAVLVRFSSSTYIFCHEYFADLNVNPTVQNH